MFVIKFENPSTSKTLLSLWEFRSERSEIKIPSTSKRQELMGRLHDALKASGYVGHDLERFLVRLVFCLLADDMGIF